jgi:hypothetical protein
VPIHVDLIQGLPGETYETWKQTIDDILSTRTHVSIEFHMALTLENTELNLLQRKLNKLKTISSSDYIFGSKAGDEIVEKIDVIGSTNSMPEDKMIDGFIYNSLIYLIFVSGSATIISLFIHRYGGIKITDIMDSIINEIKTIQWVSDEIERISQSLNRFMKTGAASYPMHDLDNYPIKAGNIYQSLAVRLYQSEEQSYEQLLDSIKLTVVNLVPDIPSALIDEVIDFNKKYFLRHNQLENYPVIFEMNHNIYEFVFTNDDLINENSRYRFETDIDKEITVGEFCKHMNVVKKIIPQAPMITRL